MDLSFSSDQTAILDALDMMLKPYEGVSLHEVGLTLTDIDYDQELQTSGFLGVGFDPDLGIGTAALVVERLARMPFATEAAISAIVHPLLGPGVVGPIVLAEQSGLARPMRFLVAGGTVVVVGDTVTSFRVTADMLRDEPEALYGYPMASLLHVPAERTDHAVSPQELRTHWQIALAAESAGLLAGALKSVCDHTSQREQFGRPLASFQALRHRLAEAQVRTNGVYWLAIKAAHTLDPADAALAALYAQESARACVYDFHQFMGAMGMTLEHPLHFWTYRLKALASELGGRGANALAAADALWG